MMWKAAMKHKNGGVNRYIKRIMVWAGLFAAVFLSLKAVFRLESQRGFDKNGFWSRAGAEVMISNIWKQ